MTETIHEPNYPDILGAITGGARYNVNVVQIALAVRPRVVRAGRPFEAILLIQNTSDVDVDVTASLQIPEQDAKKQKNRFIAKSNKLVVGLRPAEVGYVVLPISSLPDAAVSDQYKVGMSVDVKPLSKPKRIRHADGGGEIVAEYTSDHTLEKMSELKKLSFSTNRRGLMGSVIEAPFNVLSAQMGKLVDLKPGWISLWKMSDHHDDRLLLERYGDILTERILPYLKRDRLYAPLFQATRQRISAAGYDLQPIEAHFIAKLLVAVLEAAAPTEEALDPLNDERLNVQLVLKNGTDNPSALPSWCRGMLKAIDKNPSIVDSADQVLANDLYDELLRDAIRYGFNVLATTTGEELGSETDIQEYGERLISDISKSTKPLTFIDVYLPLTLGGVVMYNRVILDDEKVGESLTEIAKQMQNRRSEVNGNNELVFRMGERVIDRALQKYGYRA